MNIDVALEQARLSFMCNYTLQVQPLWRNLLKAIYNFIVNHMRFHSVLARLRLGKKIHFLVNSILSWFWKQRKDVKRAFGAVTWRKLSNKNCNISWISQWKCFKVGPMIDGIHIYCFVEKISNITNVSIFRTRFSLWCDRSEEN